MILYLSTYMSETASAPRESCAGVERAAGVGGEPVRLAIAGCGAITLTSHLPAALRSPAVRVVGLADPDPRCREAARERCGGAPVAASARLEEILEGAEAVLVASPNHTHAAVARPALERALPVLVEKPITTTYADAVQLCELAERHGTFLAGAFCTRYFPGVRLMAHLLESGYFGRLRSFRFTLGVAGGWSPVSGYNLERAASGGGVLVISGSHFLDRLLWWFGRPRSFEYEDDSYGGVEANCRATLHYDGGLEGTLFLSKTVPLPHRFTLEGETCRCELAESPAGELTVFPHDRPELQNRVAFRAPAGGPANVFEAQLADFAAAVRGLRPPLVDGRFAAESVRLAEDFYRGRSQMPEPWMWYRRPEAAS